MAPKANEPSEDDVAIARALGSYAQLRADIASWGVLPASTSAPATAEEAEAEHDDEDLFTTEPDLAGVGYVTPRVGDDARQVKTSTEKLRKQMLGKNVRNMKAGLERKSHLRTVTHPSKMAAREDEGSEEEAGRSAVGKKRGSIISGALKYEHRASDPRCKESSDESSRDVKRPGSYLDEVMAERSKKRKKNKIKDKVETVVDATK